jgi:hypothetical protein
VNEGIYAPPEGNDFCLMSGWLKTGLASVIILLLTSAKKLLTAQENSSQNLLAMSKFIVIKNLLNKFAH